MSLGLRDMSLDGSRPLLVRDMPNIDRHKQAKTMKSSPTESVAASSSVTCVCQRTGHRLSTMALARGVNHRLSTMALAC